MRASRPVPHPHALFTGSACMSAPERIPRLSIAPPSSATYMALTETPSRQRHSTGSRTSRMGQRRGAAAQPMARLLVPRVAHCGEAISRQDNAATPSQRDMFRSRRHADGAGGAGVQWRTASVSLQQTGRAAACFGASGRLHHHHHHRTNPTSCRQIAPVGPCATGKTLRLLPKGDPCECVLWLQGHRSGHRARR